MEEISRGGPRQRGCLPPYLRHTIIYNIASKIVGRRLLPVDSVTFYELDFVWYVLRILGNEGAKPLTIALTQSVTRSECDVRYFLTAKFRLT